MNRTLIVLALIIFISCKSGKKEETQENKTETNEAVNKLRFERVHDSLAIGTSLIKHYEPLNNEGMVGDFLARIWSVYGKPEKIGYDGFDYTFRDTSTGIIFTAYSGGSGPAFGARTDDEAKAIPIIKEFQELLRQAKLADCRIEFSTDFGTQISGAKNGVPYDSLGK